MLHHLTIVKSKKLLPVYEKSVIYDRFLVLGLALIVRVDKDYYVMGYLKNEEYVCIM